MERGAFALHGGFLVDVDFLVKEGVGDVRVAVGDGVLLLLLVGGSGWSGLEWEHGVHVVLVEEMPRGAHAHEDGAAVAVVEHGHGVVEDAPAWDHVVFVAVVLDVGDASGRRGGNAEARVVEVGGGGAEGVNFLDLKNC